MDRYEDSLNLYRAVLDRLEHGVPAVMASIVSQQGSGPRHIGTQMAITAEECLGTIGGSLLEAGVVDQAKLVLQSRSPCFIDFDLDNRTAGVPAMICGGKAQVFLDYVDSTPETLSFFRAAGEATETTPHFFAVTQLQTETNGIRVAGRAIMHTDGRIAGSLTLDEKDLNLVRAELGLLNDTLILPLQGSTLIIEAHQRLHTLFCFGPGHVAVPTAHIAALTGFQVVVLDDRPDLACDTRFPEAKGIHVLTDYAHAFERLDVRPDSFIVIFTRGHQFDAVLLEQALQTPAGYIGMISSRRKRETIFAALREKGFSNEALERVHAPIGIEIGAETPAEIAVSIVAQLISVRRRMAA